MAITFNCPKCGTSTNIDEKFAGQTGPCRNCGQKVTIPFPAHMAAAPATSAGGTVILVVILIVILAFFACGGLGVALLLPAVQAARESARRMQCGNNLKQIALALHNYHEANGSFPPAYTVDANGKPLHSWRTLILPFLDQEGLYRQIDLNEPWDSPKNQAFNQMILPTYHCATNSNPMDCSYVAIVGPNTIFQGPNGVKIPAITDGMSNTLMIVEVRGNTKSWMEPVDLDATTMRFQLNASPTDPGSFHPGGMNASLADGSVRFLSQSVDPKLIKSMTTINGNEPVQPPP